jgi:hypothetical protein
MSDDTFEKFGPGHHDGAASTSPYPMQRLSASHDLVNIAREIAKADAMIAAVAGGELALVAEQIRGLQQKAQQILERARDNSELHRATCRFQKRPGHVYHLYARPGGACYWSLLSPADWDGKPPDPHQGSYRLELDLSFSRVDT